MIVPGGAYLCVIDKDMPVDRSGISPWAPSPMVLFYAMMLLLMFAE